MTKPAPEHMFVLNRNHTHASVHGHSVAFVKNEPVYVPRALWTEVRGIGAIPLAEAEVHESAGPVEPTDVNERADAIKTVMRDMVTEGRREDFAANGSPHSKVISTKLGWKVERKEAEAVWLDLQREMEAGA